MWALLVFIAAGCPESATAAELDSGFGAGRGYVPVAAPDQQSDTAAAVVRQPDNNIVVLGRRVTSGRGVLLLQRYAIDATLDTSFGDHGTLTIDIPGQSLVPRHLYVQPDGRLLVAAESTSAFRVRAYLPSGQSDPSFAAGGEILLPLAPGVAAGACSFQLLNSGTMFAIMQNAPGASLGLSIYHYSRNGLSDPDFGIGGKLVLTGLGAGLSYSGVASALADDRIVLAAAGSDGVTRTLFVLGADGRPDPGFGVGGGTSPTALQGKTIRRIAPLVSDYFLVAAVAGSGSARSSTVTRFDPAGRVDTRFANGGSLHVELAGGGGNVAIEDVFEELDNNLVVTATTPDGLLAARYLQNGAPQPAFNAGRGPLLVREPESQTTQGIASLSFGGAQLVHIGSGLGFGSAPNSPSAPSLAFLVSSQDGVLDTAFGGPGLVSLFGRTLAFGEFAQQVMPLADGRALVLSATGADGGLVGTLSRFLADGNPDPAFGILGRSSFPLSGKCDWPLAMAMQPDGKVVVLGTSFNSIDCGSSAMFGKRFNVDGLPDSFSFVYSGTAQHGRSAALAIQADGKTVVTGQDDRSLVVARFLPSGSADTGFASGGRSLWLRSAGDDAKGGAVFIQPDQKIVVAGSINSTHLVLLRLDSTGTADPGFGAAGVSLVSTPGNGFLEVQALTMTPQGRLLVLARLGVHALLAQFTAAGGLDGGFGAGGLLTLPLYIGGSQYSRFGLAVQPDGGLVVSGQSTDNPASQVALLRLSASGQPDGAFGPSGMMLWRPSPFFAAGATGVAGLPGGNLLAIGYGLPGAMLARVRVADTTADIIEFHNAQLNHYFITADPAEQAAVDAGAAGPGWSRTGMAFRAYTQALGVQPGQSPVCRFYGSTAINPATGQRRGPNSHFYTAQPAECAAVQSDPGWVLEGIAFYTRLPDVYGLCAAGTVPVFRNYNNRAQFNDSNHRYTTDFATYQSMQTLGWKPEGIVFCAAPG
jgi:uncharacterized delta-60 repeat protein